jgi:hypothetical protein
MGRDAFGVSDAGVSGGGDALTAVVGLGVVETGPSCGHP